MAGSQVRIENLAKIFYNEKQQIIALEDTNLRIDEGDFFCILGPSGCGKSTLLRCIAGFEQVTAGTILVGEQRVIKPGPDRIMVFQGFEQLLPWKTIIENVEYPLKINNAASKPEIKKRAGEYLSLVGLEEFAHNFPHQLSGGMKQRVAIARALALNPKVLLMDEPFASLDAQTRGVLQKELIAIWENLKTTIIFITHNVEEAVILGNKIAVMSKRPGTIKKVIENDLPRPRTIGNSGFSELWQELNSLLEI